jgi:uncharacterized protein (DUF4415 family)
MIVANGKARGLHRFHCNLWHNGNRQAARIVPVHSACLCFAWRLVTRQYQRMGRDDSRDRSRDWRDAPKTRREPDARAAAERAFKAVTTKRVEGPPSAPPAPLPGVKETVTLRIDRDVLDFFQNGGPGWQDRINAALRKAIGK